MSDDGAVEDISKALEQAPGALSRRYKGEVRGGKELTRARRIMGLNMRIKGHTWDQIAQALGVSETYARGVVMQLLDQGTRQVADEMRAIENARLEVANAAIWPAVKKGNLGAVDTFVRLSKHRAELNGLSMPKRIEVGGEIRTKMSDALAELERVLSDGPGIVLDAEVVGDDEEDGDGNGS